MTSDEIYLLITHEDREPLSTLGAELRRINPCHNFGTWRGGGALTPEGRVETRKEHSSHVISFFTLEQRKRVEAAMQTIYGQARRLGVVFEYQLGYQDKHLEGSSTEAEINQAIDWILEEMGEKETG
jgi:hypothetical protein